MSLPDPQGADGARAAVARRRGRPGLVELAFLFGLVAFVLVAAGLTIEVGFRDPGSQGADPDVSASAPEAPAGPEESAADDVTPGLVPPAELVPADVSVQILDGGVGEERITEVVTSLQREGFRVVATNTAREHEDSIVLFTTGFEQEALRVAEHLGVTDVRPMDVLPPERRLSESVMVHVIIGRD